MLQLLWDLEKKLYNHKKLSNDEDFLIKFFGIIFRDRKFQLSIKYKIEVKTKARSRSYQALFLQK